MRPEDILLLKGIRTIRPLGAIQAFVPEPLV